jgi:CubicO group peptidase (beta-lactamase class C family)
MVSQMTWIEKKQIVALVLLFTVVCQWGAQGQEAAPTVEERVDGVFARFDNTRSPGCSMGVIQDGEFVFRRGYGMANLELGVPLSSSSVFRIGSTSKQFTAAAIVLLAEEGKISLDDDVRTYLPELTDFGTPVTIRRLVHHTSGYRDYLTLMSLAGLRDDDYYTDEDLLAMLSRQRELNFAPGDEHLYSNSGYWLLSQVVKRASGKSLREYAAEKIFAPLGMDHTHFHDDHAELVPNRAYGYAPDEDGGYRISMTTLPMIGDGGVFTSVDDLLMWDRNFYDQRIGGQGFLEQMHAVGILNDGEELDYAFGLGVGSYRGLRLVSHGGAFVGFRADLIRFPDERFSVICLCNRADSNPSLLARRVADIYLEDKLAPLEDSDRPRRERAEEEEGLELDARARSGLIGDYYSEELDVIYAIGEADAGLQLSVAGQPPLPLRARDEDVLVARFMTLRFQRDTSGAATGFQLDAGRVKNLRFERVRE